MTQSTDKVFCTICQKSVTFHTDRIDHKKEFIRSVCTLGLWLPFWFIQAVGTVRRCDSCDNSIES